MKTNHRSRALAALLVGVLGAASLAGCSTYAPSDHIVLYYAGGTMENQQFQECIQPGTSGSYPVDDSTFALPTSLRVWNAVENGTGDTKDPVKVMSKQVDGQPGQTMDVFSASSFYLNTDCKDGANSPIVQFWQKTGKRFHVADDGAETFSESGWKKMLENTLVIAQQAAFGKASPYFTSDELDSGANGVWVKMEHIIATEFRNLLREQVGGDYFCGPGFSAGKEVSWSTWKVDGVDAQGIPQVKEVEEKGTCPPVKITITGIDYNNKNIQAARAAVFEADQKAKAALIAAKSQADVAAILDAAAKNSAYVELRKAELCAASPNCVMITGGNGGVTVPIK